MKMFSIRLALTIMFILIAGIAFAHHVRDGTAPIAIAQHSIMMATLGPAILMPAIVTSDPTEAKSVVIIAIKDSTAPWGRTANVFYKGQVSAPARMASYT